MKRVIMISVVTIVIATLAACSGSTPATVPAADTTAKASTDTSAKMVAMDTTKMPMDTMKMSSTTSTVKYTCRMHPEVISDKPGKCPKCGMQLVEVKSTEMRSTMSMGHDSTMSK
jgi:predicted small lipoprotein YifL